MQRVSSLSRKKALLASAEPPASSVQDFRTKINAPLLFLLGAHDRRIGDILGLEKQPSDARIPVGEEFLRERSICFDTSLVFNYDLRLYRNLRAVTVKASKRVYLSSFNGSQLERLTIEAVEEVNADFADSVKIHTLVLRGIRWQYSMLETVLTTCRPDKLVLENARCYDIGSIEHHQLVRLFCSLQLLAFDSHKSFVGDSAFEQIAKNGKIMSYSYKEADIRLLYRAQGPYLRACVLEQYQVPMNVCVDHLRTIEYLEIHGNSNVTYLSSGLPALRCLKLVGVLLDGALIKALGSIRSVYLMRCHFTAVSFYDFVKALASSARYICFDATQIPLDAFAFIKSTLSSCQIVVPGVVSFYVDKK
ncbi:hypothetical protein PAPHI01_0227 [Pancytospora philotis]|nr:hypothetical protein PAPHI01_0227 [Pancytospora philotis]